MTEEPPPSAASSPSGPRPRDSSGSDSLAAGLALSRPRFWPRALPRFYTSRSVLGLLWLGAVFLPVLALIAGGWITWQFVVATQISQMDRTAGAIVAQTRSTLETGEAVLRATEARIAGWDWPRIASDPRLADFVRHVDQATPVVAIGIRLPDGRSRLLSAASRQAEEEGALGAQLARVFPSPGGSRDGSAGPGRVLAVCIAGHRRVLLAHPRHDAAGAAEGGVLAVFFAPDLLKASLAQLAPAPGAAFSLVDAEGQVLVAHSGGGATGPDRIVAPALLSLLPAGARQPTLLRAGSLFGGFLLATARPVLPYGLVVLYAADPESLRAEWMRQMALFAAGSLLMMVLLCVLTVQAQRRLSDERERIAQRTTDALERAETEARLRQVEKVAVLGQLSAGVAHDFNNLLQSILVSADTLTQPGQPPAEVRRVAELILRVCHRGTALTRHLLAFSRRDRQPVANTELAVALRDVGELLGRLLGRGYRLAVAPVPEGLHAACHPAEFESVILNLAVNSRDAMPEGGEISLRVEAPAGGQVRIVVEDTGLGMDAATLVRAGEAFFTTKAADRGTGLGLSMVRDFARRCGGQLDIASQPGHGTRVTLTLPVALSLIHI